MREIPFDPGLIDDPWVFDEIPGLTEPEFDSEFAERIKDAVEALPKDECAVVECIIWGQMTKIETGKLLGRSRQSVHDVFKRAVETLAKELTDAPS